MALAGEIGIQVGGCMQAIMLRADALHLKHTANTTWPAKDINAEGCGGSQIGASEKEAYWEIEGCLLRVYLQGGSAQISCWASTPEAATEGLAWADSICPRHETKTDLIPVTFWSLSHDGPRSIRREIDRAVWGDIEPNYPSAPGLERMMGDDFRPGVGGQLLLWHGPPGTGKTTALRALAHEWREWCELHYIADPESFFGDHASYMMQVLMGNTYKEIGAKHEPDWRVIVLEDCGEMLALDARREVGQALSRLLNACDGLIGRGLRFLVLVTTNEEVSKLHPAVSRPGRCAANVEFGGFTPDEARDWLEAHGHRNGQPGACQLADLYAHLSDGNPRPAERPVGFVR